jgi:hypothetical protein
MKQVFVFVFASLLLVSCGGSRDPVPTDVIGHWEIAHSKKIIGYLNLQENGICRLSCPSEIIENKQLIPDAVPVLVTGEWSLVEIERKLSIRCRLPNYPNAGHDQYFDLVWAGGCFRVTLGDPDRRLFIEARKQQSEK